MKVNEDFLRYIGIWTQSDAESAETPSSMRQFDLSHLLAYQLQKLPMDYAEVDNYGNVYGKLMPSPGREGSTPLGLIAHIDTFPGFNGKDVNPQIIEDYDGGIVPLGGSGLFLDPAEYPHLKELAGQTLITTDGTTLLGADDKAGIAEIMQALRAIIEGKVPHGQVSVAFVTDQEIGRGTDHFDLKKFGARYAYTVDGWECGEIQYDNFNASEITIRIRGRETHTGLGKQLLINSQLLAMEINQKLPPDEIPYCTAGREGFYHLRSFRGTVAQTEMVYALRDHDEEKLKDRVDRITNACEEINRKYGGNYVTWSIREEYRNMRPRIEPCFHLVEHAEAAMKKLGVEPHLTPARGGTDGARLSYRGLPCPNLGAGGYCYHGPYEHITAEAIEKTAAILTEIVRSYAGETL